MAAASHAPQPDGGSSASSAANLARKSGPSPQNPRPGCHEDTCLRRDPQSRDCQWDATTARETWLRGMHIELRYSAACGSVRGRVDNGAVGDSVPIKGPMNPGEHPCMEPQRTPPQFEACWLLAWESAGHLSLNPCVPVLRCAS
ncbi:DUF2690 domain-containing protein [Streptomyces aureus]|uniref:DUF2690 domain-containing protein n=1 Tax=Streptomyces aureus TaxID=193461 RepID=UPI00131A6AEA